MPRAIVVAFDGAQSLDVFGPAEVFAAAGRELAARGVGGGYRVVLASSGGGPRTISTGTSIDTTPLAALHPKASDTVLVVGGEEDAVTAAVRDRELARFLRRARGVVRRLGSVCSGAFVLAAAGLLDGRRCATHWSACARLAELFPAVEVDRDAIFVVDGTLWTSAGVTTGVDMALAMVEQDHGRSVADAVAARLVLYTRRPGFQSQWSDALVAQQQHSDPLGPTLGWARRHLRELNVDVLAQRAGLSVRTLHRRTREVLGATPAKVIERLRAEHARALLSTTSLQHKQVADRCGFGDTARMQRALKRSVGVDARALRLLFAAPPTRQRDRPRSSRTSP